MTTMQVPIQLRRGTAAQAASDNPTLLSGEVGVETDTGKFKIGDGSTAWNSLPYATDVSRLPASVGNAALPAYVQVPAGWGTFWTPAKALAKAGSGLARLGIIGDSIAQLFDASSHANSWPGLLAAALQSSYGDGGSGFLCAANSVVYATSETPNSGGYTAAQLGITTTGAWNNGGYSEGGTNGDGPGACGITSNSNASTLTFSVRGTSITIYTLLIGTALSPVTGAVFDWTIDGTAQTPINMTGSASTTGIQETTVTGLASANHTVVLTVTGAGSQAYANFFGARGVNASGVVVDNYARSGALTSTYVTQRSNYGNPAAWSGGNLQPCDLLIYELGVNDAHNDVSADTVSDNIRAALTQIRDSGAMDGATDLLFLHPHIGTWEGASPYYHDYLERVRALAKTYNAAVVDMWSFYRNSYAYGVSQGYFAVPNHAGTGAAGTTGNSDPVHPSDTGHASIFTNGLSAVPGLL